MDNTIENPLVITCIGNTFKLNKRLVVEDEESFEFVDKKLAVQLKKQSVSSFLGSLIDIAIEKAKKKTGIDWQYIDFDKLIYNNGGDITVEFKEFLEESEPPLQCSVTIFKGQIEKLGM